MEIYEKPLQVGQYLRFIKIPLGEIPPIVDNRITFPNGMTCNARSPRMKLLWVCKNLTCEFCGISTSFAALEAHPETPDSTHLNFYAKDFMGREVLMTWDHIIPKSLGGPNTLSNAQCLCSICNGLKGNSKTQKEVKEERRLKGLPTRYEYFGDGNAKFFWNKHQFTTNLSGDTQTVVCNEGKE